MPLIAAATTKAIRMRRAAKNRRSRCSRPSDALVTSSSAANSTPTSAPYTGHGQVSVQPKAPWVNGSIGSACRPCSQCDSSSEANSTPTMLRMATPSRCHQSVVREVASSGRVRVARTLLHTPTSITMTKAGSSSTRCGWRTGSPHQGLLPPPSQRVSVTTNQGTSSTSTSSGSRIAWLSSVLRR